LTANHSHLPRFAGIGTEFSVLYCPSHGQYHFIKIKIDTVMAKKLAISPIAGTKNRVFVKPAPAEEKTSGGIIIPDTAKEKPQRGEVVAISDIDEDGKKPVVKVGDVVLYGKYSGTEISFEGQDFLSMRESDIIAKF
jgi:chaperonin GroES